MGSLGMTLCLLGCRFAPGGSCFAINEVILRTGPFEEAGSSSGTRVQIPGPVCCHCASLFGFMISVCERSTARALDWFTTSNLVSPARHSSITRPALTARPSSNAFARDCCVGSQSFGLAPSAKAARGRLDMKGFRQPFGRLRFRRAEGQPFQVRVRRFQASCS